MVLAKIAYEAYGRSAGGFSVKGEALPDFENVGENVKRHWMAAVSAVVQATHEEEQISGAQLGRDGRPADDR